jgi:hypothetical protein
MEIKIMAQKIKTLWANFTKSPEQKYLEQAVDLVDLEQRIKKLSVERMRGIWL